MAQRVVVRAVALLSAKLSEKRKSSEMIGDMYVSIIVFFARCCLGKVPGGAPFSQLHKSDKQSRVDKP